MPLLALFSVVFYSIEYGISWAEPVIFVVFYLACGLSITAGYHRLFSHRTHKAAWPMRLFYALFGAAAFQNSAIKWCSDHRRHHLKTDEEEDPYTVKKGFMWAHMGWVMVDQGEEIVEHVEDLQDDPILAWQDRHIFLIGFLVGIVLPGAIGFLALGGVHGFLGGMIYGGFLRVVIVHHATFLINSAAHTWGTQPYSTANTSRDSPVLSFFTFGEGYHNFHHTFQADYRNGHKWYHVDPSKWWIKSFNYLGLNTQLKSTPKHSIEVAKVNMRFKKRAQRLENRNVNIHKFEDRLAKCRDNLRSKMFEFHRAKKEFKNMARESKVAMKMKVNELKNSVRTARDDLQQLFRDMKIEYKQAKLTA